jgi:LPS sulfotransferase NodH
LLCSVRWGVQSGVVTEPRLSYLVAATQRSGSTLLCRALADTEAAGRPEEYFLCGPPEAFPPGWTFWEDGLFAQRHDSLDRDGYLKLVFDLGTTTNGVFGAKLMWNNLPWVLDKLGELPRFRGLDPAATFHALFPDLHVIHLVRRDRVRQAVSWARAAQEGVWVVSDTEPAKPAAKPVYDHDFIAALEGLLMEGDQGWPALCSELNVEPLTIYYEDLVDPTGYEDNIRSILDHLQVDATSVQIPSTSNEPSSRCDERGLGPSLPNQPPHRRPTLRRPLTPGQRLRYGRWTPVPGALRQGSKCWQSRVERGVDALPCQDLERLMAVAGTRRWRWPVPSLFCRVGLCAQSRGDGLAAAL